MREAPDRLAVDGGTPVRTEPLLPGYPGGLLIGDEEKAAVLEVLESQSLFRHYGPQPLHKVTQFERAFAQTMGARHAASRAALKRSDSAGNLLSSMSSSNSFDNSSPYWLLLRASSIRNYPLAPWSRV